MCPEPWKNAINFCLLVLNTTRFCLNLLLDFSSVGQIINFFFNLLVERSNQEGKVKVHAFNSFFYPKRVKSGYASLKRWTKKVRRFALCHALALFPSSRYLNCNAKIVTPSLLVEEKFCLTTRNNWSYQCHFIPFD